ncbi:MAG: hypothetical protein IPM51_12245 [Sphingobacteriaceae bacterium]|nr:hypothetical protein [Sphingobacteriaceae bacterium]
MYQDKAQGFKRDWFAELKRTKHPNHGKLAFDYFTPAVDDTFGRKIKGGPERFIKQVMLQNDLYDKARNNTEKQSRAKQQNISQQNQLGSTIFETDQALNKGIGKTYEELKKAEASDEKLKILRRADQMLNTISGRLGRDGQNYGYRDDIPDADRGDEVMWEPEYISDERRSGGRAQSFVLPHQEDYIAVIDDPDYAYDYGDRQYRAPPVSFDPYSDYTRSLLRAPSYQTGEPSQPDRLAPARRSSDIGGSSGNFP